ncbi:uncharacterized protein LOC110181884 [Drosophila serrata]|uniref:uncharacterized protein LOC110181884 n=1 Tax=Drosophila serrata TaxID=7274 RepID=UPI000A1D20D2|nr:uncharacterized protein LOC110181884 [Drosophila serrata]KAH8356892.1 hypothetical protein KR200_010647 [Drosophila serrata]
MAEGFKKYFNGTTISGRANVAKATYATLALLFILYRMRRGSSKQSQLASDTCSCDAEADPMPHGDTGIYGTDPDCSVCRDRSERAMSEYDREQRRKAAAEDNGCRDDPPPPPPSNGGAGSSKPRAKCPCEDSQKRVNSALKNNSNSSHSKAWSHQLQPPNQYRQHFQQQSAPTPSEQENPVGELIGQVHDAVSRVVRGVVGAVLGGAAVSTTGSSSVGEAQSQSYYEQDEDEEEDEEEEEWDDGQAYGSRNNPLFCTPTSNNNGTSRPTEETATDSYNAFSDGFASDMFFTSDAK